jgi:hypothetical protein
MQPLKNVISALRRQIIDALEMDRDLPGLTRLEAERVVVSLSFTHEQAQDGTLQFSCIGSGPAAGNHNLTIEFRLTPTATGAENSPASNTSTASAPPHPAGFDSAQARKATDSLASIFGAPGFDSSARATVFREALAGVSDDQARAIIDSLRGLPTPGITPAAARARHLINRLIASGHAGPTRGREILAEILYQHSVQSVIRLVRDQWKTQEEWLGE